MTLQLLSFVAAVASCTTIAEAFGCVAYNNSSKCVADKALPVCFGPPLLAERLSGNLMRMMPINTCTATENPPAPRKAFETCIILIQGYGCCFVLLPSQEAGYQTAVVCSVVSEQVMADDKEIQWLIKMMPLFTGQFVSLHLQGTLRSEKGTYIKLPPRKHYLNPSQDNAKMLQKAFAFLCRKAYSSSILDIIMTFTAVMLVVRWYNRACKKQGGEFKTCTICLQEYKKGDLLKVLPCSHAYCRDCINSWFHIQPRNKTCPYCMQPVNTSPTKSRLVKM